MPANLDNENQFQFPATDKERFDLCLSMLKAYYDALEGRLMANVGFFTLIIGWLMSSQSARDGLHGKGWFLSLALATLTLVVITYGLNVARWIYRWRQIRGYIDGIRYVEPRFYVRYEVPKWLGFVYFAPVVCLYFFVIACIMLIVTGRIN